MYVFNSLEAVFIAHVLSLEKKGLECPLRIAKEPFQLVTENLSYLVLTEPFPTPDNIIAPFLLLVT